MLLREHASEKWFVIPPLLTNVSALPGETWTSEIESLQSFCILKNDTDLVCYIFKTHSPILIILAGNNYGIFAIISLSNFSCMFAIIFLIWSEITKVKTMHFWRHWSVINMPFTEEDKMLINNLFDLKGYNGKNLVREFPSKSWNVGLFYQLLQKLWVTGLVDRCSSSSRWCNTRTADNIDLVDELRSHKNGQARDNIFTLYLILRHYCLQIIINIGW